MREAIVSGLTAPGGGAPLHLVSVAQQVGEEILRGAALSPDSGLFPIRQGILDFLPRGVGPLSLAQRTNLLEPTSWGYEWPWRATSLSLFSRTHLPLPREQAILHEMLGSPAGNLWLDLAASTGLYGRWLAPRLAQHGGEVIALDLAWPMLRRAHHAATREGQRNLSFVCARGERLPFATGSLDGVVCGGSLNEFGTRGAPVVLAEVARTLRVGGVALFMHLLEAPQGVGALAQRATRLGGIAFWGRSAATDLFEQAGLCVEATQAVGIVAFSLVRRGANGNK